MAAGYFSSSLFLYNCEGIRVIHKARPGLCCLEEAPNHTPPSATKRNFELGELNIDSSSGKARKQNPLGWLQGVESKANVNVKLAEHLQGNDYK